MAVAVTVGVVVCTAGVAVGGGAVAMGVRSSVGVADSGASGSKKPDVRFMADGR